MSDSELTNHGFLQSEKLGLFLAAKHRIIHIFSSDLQRAYITAKQVWGGQRRQYGKSVEALRIRKLPILRERDFGSYERMPQSTSTSRVEDADRESHLHQDPGFREVESHASMARRADQFLEEHLLPLALGPHADTAGTVAVVSHGLLLVAMWRCLLRRFAVHSVSVAPSVPIPLGVAFTLEKAASFSNTGYLSLSMRKEMIQIHSAGITEIVAAQTEQEPEDPRQSHLPQVLYGWALTVHAINSREHLQGLKRTRGGVGSSRYDAKQTSIDTFFKK